MEETSPGKAEEPWAEGEQERPEEPTGKMTRRVEEGKRSPPEGVRWDPAVHADRRWRKRSDEPSSR